MDNSDPQFRLRTRKSPSMLIDETKRKISPMKKNKKTNERTLIHQEVDEGGLMVDPLHIAFCLEMQYWKMDDKMEVRGRFISGDT